MSVNVNEKPQMVANNKPAVVKSTPAEVSTPVKNMDAPSDTQLIEQAVRESLQQLVAEAVAAAMPANTSDDAEEAAVAVAVPTVAACDAEVHPAPAAVAGESDDTGALAAADAALHLFAGRSHSTNGGGAEEDNAKEAAEDEVVVDLADTAAAEAAAVEAEEAAIAAVAAAASAVNGLDSVSLHPQPTRARSPSVSVSRGSRHAEPAMLVLTNAPDDEKEQPPRPATFGSSSQHRASVSRLAHPAPATVIAADVAANARAFTWTNAGSASQAAASTSSTESASSPRNFADAMLSPPLNKQLTIKVDSSAAASPVSPSSRLPTPNKLTAAAAVVAAKESAKISAAAAMALSAAEKKLKRARRTWVGVNIAMVLLFVAVDVYSLVRTPLPADAVNEPILLAGWSAHVLGLVLVLTQVIVALVRHTPYAGEQQVLAVVGLTGLVGGMACMCKRQWSSDALLTVPFSSASTADSTVVQLLALVALVHFVVVCALLYHTPMGAAQYAALKAAAMMASHADARAQNVAHVRKLEARNSQLTAQLLRLARALEKSAVGGASSRNSAPMSPTAAAATAAMMMMQSGSSDESIMVGTIKETDLSQMSVVSEEDHAAANDAQPQHRRQPTGTTVQSPVSAVTTPSRTRPGSGCDLYSGHLSVASPSVQLKPRARVRHGGALVPGAGLGSPKHSRAQSATLNPSAVSAMMASLNANNSNAGSPAPAVVGILSRATTSSVGPTPPASATPVSPTDSTLTPTTSTGSHSSGLNSLRRHKRNVSSSQPVVDECDTAVVCHALLTVPKLYKSKTLDVREADAVQVKVDLSGDEKKNAMGVRPYCGPLVAARHAQLKEAGLVV